MTPDHITGPPTVAEALRAGAAALTNSPTPRLDSRVLLKYALGADDAQLIARDGARLSPGEAAAYDALIRRRSGGEPVAYLTGEKEFWSLSFKVTPDVLIPRDDSECLIAAVLARRQRKEALTILDLGTGSGCLLCALLSELPGSVGLGIDMSEGALAVARANAAALGLAGQSLFAAGDWLAPVGRPVDIIIANPPYIPVGDQPGLPVDVAGFEPEGALFAGEDGMDAYRAILAAAPAALRDGGLIVFETGEQQAGPLLAMVKETFPRPAAIELVFDLEGRRRGVAADFRFGEKRD